jgi:hypothetical protein
MELHLYSPICLYGVDSGNFTFLTSSAQQPQNVHTLQFFICVKTKWTLSVQNIRRWILLRRSKNTAHDTDV